MVNALETIFPRLQGSSYRITSPRERRYNCIAWAAGNQSNWWWPGPVGTAHWPDGLGRSVTLQSLREAFETLGYVACENEQSESGFEKIALFVAADGTPTHAARQLPSGRWTSKLGRMEDIEHALYDLTGVVYGSVVQIMKRPLSTAAGEKTESGSA